MTSAEFLGYFQNVKPAGANQWMAQCPAHDDPQNSLSIRFTEEHKWLLKDFAGCRVPDIVKAAGLNLTDLFPKNGAARTATPPATSLTLSAFALAKGLPADFLADCGVEEDQRGLVITYRLHDGSPALRQRRRTALAAKDGSTWAGPPGHPLVAYGLWRLDAAREKGELLLVEGETDALTAWYHNQPALGIPGAEMVKLLAREDLVT